MRDLIRQINAAVANIQAGIQSDITVIPCKLWLGVTAGQTHVIILLLVLGNTLKLHICRKMYVCLVKYLIIIIVICTFIPYMIP